jgi:hypothetical protein
MPETESLAIPASRSTRPSSEMRSLRLDLFPPNTSPTVSGVLDRRTVAVDFG